MKYSTNVLTNLEQIGSGLRQQRKRRGLTQAEVAKAARISRATLSLLENGLLSELGIKKVLRVAEILGLELALRPAGAAPTLEELQEQREA
jgi:transcriptional regulator with XRE-family HTH domain